MTKQWWVIVVMPELSVAALGPFQTQEAAGRVVDNLLRQSIKSTIVED